jgi:hypothetical protein
MSFARSLAVFVLSFIFASSILMGITSYNIGNLIQKKSIKVFIKTESMSFINDQCKENCAPYPEYKDLCIDQCLATLTNETESSVNKAVDGIYQQKLANWVSLDELASFMSQYVLFFVIGIIVGIMILIASKTPFLTLGKDFISIAISLFISSVTPEFMLASINLPFDLGKAIKEYFSPGFRYLLYYGIIFLAVGIILIIIDHFLEKRKRFKEADKKEAEKKKDEDKNKK